MENKNLDSSKIKDILPEYQPIKLNGINLAQNYVSAFNTGMNIYQCINQLQGSIEWLVKAVNDVVIEWNKTIEDTQEATIQYVKDQLPGMVDERVTEAITQLQEQYATTLEKLDKEQKAQATQISNINTHLSNIDSDITSLKQSNTTLQSNVQDNLEQITNLESEINKLKTEIDNIKKGATPVASEKDDLNV